jgi:hypothetical protein
MYLGLLRKNTTYGLAGQLGKTSCDSEIWGGLGNGDNRTRFRRKSGFCRAVANKLAERGIHVVVVGRNMNRGEKAIAEIRAAGGQDPISNEPFVT